MTAREFTENWSPLSDSLYRVAYYILESEEDAMDAVQDLYVKLWKSLDSLDSIGNPKAYCVTMIRNICMDRIRKLKTAAPSGAFPETADSGEDIQLELENKEKLKRVMAAIRQLPEGQRQALQMKVIEDLSYEEISQRTGMNNLTLRVLLSQARAKLKKLI